MILQKRDWLVRVAGIEFSGLDMSFEIEKTVRSEPNKCSITIYNLSQNSRNLIESLNLYDPKKSTAPKARGNVAATPKAAKDGNIRVEIEAGYKDARSLLFRGDLRRGISTRNGGTWETKIEGEDGGASALEARVKETFPAGTPRLAVVKKCADAMGVGLGNIVEVGDLITGVYSAGTILDGSATDEMKGLLRRMKLTYSIQNGVMQFRRVGRGIGLKVQATVLSQETGLVGSPERDATGEVKCKALLVPNLAPGGYVLLATVNPNYNGVYQIVGVQHRGDTAGTDWYHELSLLPG